VRAEMLSRGKKVYNVYDGFYYDDDIKDEIKKVVEDKAKYVYERWMLPVKL
jgi:hypothetical protein